MAKAPEQILTRGRQLVAAALLATMAAAPVAADVGEAVADVAKAGDDGAGADEIVVSAALQRNRLDVPSPVTIIEGAALLRDARTQIGDSLSRVPGASAASFGPNTSRPVLRGLTGERVRVLTDGIGAFDVSNTSADHAVAIDPLTALRIEVVRGPAALRFGTSAIGGLINVFDGRIPTDVPENALAADITAGLGSAATERRAAAGVTARLGGSVALRVGGGLVDRRCP